MEFPAAGAVVAPFAATVAYSRVHTGVHGVSDMLGGLALGCGIALAIRRWWRVRPICRAVAAAVATARSPCSPGALLHLR